LQLQLGGIYYNLYEVENLKRAAGRVGEGPGEALCGGGTGGGGADGGAVEGFSGAQVSLAVDLIVMPMTV
jgi:hypothetical protein